MVLEIVEARLNPAVTREMFMQKSQAMVNAFLKGRLGFLHRSVWLLEDGRCGAILTWESEFSAKEAMACAFQYEAVREFAACFIEGSYTMMLAPLLEENSV